MKRGVISFVFDDGYEAVYRDVVPALEQHGFHGVFALPLAPEALATQSKQPVQPWEHWLPLQTHSHELAAHSVMHHDLTTLTPEELERDIQACQQAWGATTLIYPGGAYNQLVRQVAARYFTAARTVQRGFESHHPNDFFALKTFNFTKHNFSLLKANSLALWAWVTNSWLIETYHLVDDAPTDLVHSVTLREFKQHLAFVRRLPLSNKTIHEVVRDCHN